MPMFTSARVLSIRHDVRARSTTERFTGVADKGVGSPAVIQSILDAHRLMLGAVIAQQLVDAEAGVPLSPRVAPERLDKSQKAELKDALSRSTRQWAWSRRGDYEETLMPRSNSRPSSLQRQTTAAMRSTSRSAPRRNRPSGRARKMRNGSVEPFRVEGYQFINAVAVASGSASVRQRVVWQRAVGAQQENSRGIQPRGHWDHHQGLHASNSQHHEKSRCLNSLGDDGQQKEIRKIDRKRCVAQPGEQAGNPINPTHAQ